MWTMHLVDEYVWNGFSSVTEKVKQECDFWVFNFERLNGPEEEKLDGRVTIGLPVRLWNWAPSSLMLWRSLAG